MSGGIWGRLVQGQQIKMSRSKKIKDFMVNLVARALLGGALLLPYGPRVRAMGWLVSRVVAPLAGWDKRIRANLSHVMPDLDPAEVRRLVRAVPDNTGRTLIEIYSGEEFSRRVRDIPLTGPGAEALKAAHEAGRPAIIVTGHFGNYDAPRAAIIGKGYRIGGLYRPMSNAAFNAHYVRAISTIGQPVFPSDRKGFAELLKFLKSGGMVGLVVDIYAEPGALLNFFGKPAPTATSAAELALKHEAPLVPVYGIRKANGLDFEIIVEEPIPHSDPETMTQALNDSLEAHVRSHMGQWFWIHRRWKPERQRALAEAANIGP